MHLLLSIINILKGKRQGGRSSFQKLIYNTSIMMSKYYYTIKETSDLRKIGHENGVLPFKLCMD